MKLFNQIKQPVVINVTKVVKLHQELEQIDKEIEEINNYSRLLACGKSTSTMSFTIINTAKKTRRDKVIDSDGDLINESESRYIETGFGFARVFFPGSQLEEAHTSWNPFLTPETMLRIMQIIFNDKKKEREEILKKFEVEGIKIK